MAKIGPKEKPLELTVTHGDRLNPMGADILFQMFEEELLGIARRHHGLSTIPATITPIKEVDRYSSE